MTELADPKEVGMEKFINVVRKVKPNIMTLTGALYDITDFEGLDGKITAIFLELYEEGTNKKTDRGLLLPFFLEKLNPNNLSEVQRKEIDSIVNQKESGSLP